MSFILLDKLNMMIIFAAGISLLIAGFYEQNWNWVGIGLLLQNQIFLYSKLDEVDS